MEDLVRGDFEIILVLDPDLEVLGSEEAQSLPKLEGLALVHHHAELSLEQVHDVLAADRLLFRRLNSSATLACSQRHRLRFQRCALLAIERNISLSGHFLRLGFFPAFLRRLLGRSNLAPTNSRLALPDIPPSPLDEIPHLRVRKVCLAPQETIEQRLDPLHESLDRASLRSSLRLGDCDSVLLSDSVVVARPHRRSELGNGFFRCELLANGLALAKHGAPFCNRCRELVNHRILAGDSTSCYKRITRLRPPCASCDQTSKPSVSRNLMRGRPSHLGGRRVSWRNDIDGIRFRIVSASKSMALTQLEPSTRIGI